MIRTDLTFFGEELAEVTETKQMKQAQIALANLRNKTCVGKEWTGWFDWPRTHGLALVERVEQFVSEKSSQYDAVVVVGIGGSYLGARAVVDALTVAGDAHVPVYFLGQHLSSRSTRDVLTRLKGKRPIVNVISKSGTTTEPAVAFRVLRDWLVNELGEKEFWQRVVCTTDPKKGALHQLAKTKDLPMFDVPEDVGGRYSVLTAVGLLPLALAGYDIDAMMKGADTFFKRVREDDDASVCRYAAARQVAYQHYKKVIEFYAYAEPGTAMLVEWLKQLFGESEGKQGMGILPAGLAYTTDLHSLGQLAQEGQRNIFETFLNFAPEQNELPTPTGESEDGLDYLVGRSIDDINRQAVLATKLAHFDGGVPCIDINCGPLNEETLGEMFGFFETACALSAAMQGVNPFDQPGVEAYKQNLFGLLGKPGFEAVGQALRSRLN